MPRPILQAFLLADYVYQDTDTGKKIIAGTFNRISAPSFPVVYPFCTAFISLTDVKGTISLELQFRNLKTNEVIATFGGIDLHAEDPHQTVELTSQIHGLVFPDSGIFSIDVVHDEEILGSFRLSAVQSS